MLPWSRVYGWSFSFPFKIISFLIYYLFCYFFYLFIFWRVIYSWIKTLLIEIRLWLVKIDCLKNIKMKMIDSNMTSLNLSTHFIRVTPWSSGCAMLRYTIQRFTIHRSKSHAKMIETNLNLQRNHATKKLNFAEQKIELLLHVNALLHDITCV